MNDMTAAERHTVTHGLEVAAEIFDKHVEQLIQANAHEPLIQQFRKQAADARAMRDRIANATREVNHQLTTEKYNGLLTAALTAELARRMAGPTNARIFQDGKVYRPAGYRIPEDGETYVAKDGYVKVAAGGAPFDGVRLILREV